MSEAKGYPEQASKEEISSALFANMVMQQSNMALMFLGQVPHPESGERVVDLDAAKMFIDTIEMLEAKTKGNLNKNEETMLKRNLTALRMAFVEASNQKSSPAAKQEPSGAKASASGTPPGSATQPAASAGEAAGGSEAEAESRKKFSKKY